MENGLRTPNEGINQRNLKIWADVADKIYLGRTYLKIWDWELIFGHAVKVISSPGVRSPWFKGSSVKDVSNFFCIFDTPSPKSAVFDTYAMAYFDQLLTPAPLNC